MHRAFSRHCARLSQPARSTFRTAVRCFSIETPPPRLPITQTVSATASQPLSWAVIGVTGLAIAALLHDSEIFYRSEKTQQQDKGKHEAYKPSDQSKDSGKSESERSNKESKNDSDGTSDDQSKDTSSSSQFKSAPHQATPKGGQSGKDASHPSLSKDKADAGEDDTQSTVDDKSKSKSPSDKQSQSKDGQSKPVSDNHTKKPSSEDAAKQSEGAMNSAGQKKPKSVSHHTDQSTEDKQKGQKEAVDASNKPTPGANAGGGAEKTASQANNKQQLQSQSRSSSAETKPAEESKQQPKKDESKKSDDDKKAKPDDRKGSSEEGSSSTGSGSASLSKSAHHQATSKGGQAGSEGSADASSKGSTDAGSGGKGSTKPAQSPADRNDASKSSKDSKKDEAKSTANHSKPLTIDDNPSDAELMHLNSYFSSPADAHPTKPGLRILTANRIDTVLSQSVPFLLYVYDPACTSCSMYSPIIESLAIALKESGDDRLRVYTMNDATDYKPGFLTRSVTEEAGMRLPLIQFFPQPSASSPSQSVTFSDTPTIDNLVDFINNHSNTKINKSAIKAIFRAQLPELQSQLRLSGLSHLESSNDWQLFQSSPCGDSISDYSLHQLVNQFLNDSEVQAVTERSYQQFVECMRDKQDEAIAYFDNIQHIANETQQALLTKKHQR